MKKINSLLLALFVVVCSVHAQSYQSQPVYTSSYSSYSPIPTYTDSEIKTRLNNITSQVVPPRFGPVVRSYVKTYTVLNRDKTEKMIGRATMYFPIFEKYLREKNLPVDLKYLPVVESALNPNAISRSKAVGLWQFMEGTGKEYGLRVSKVVDERRDPNKATLAAIDFLTNLYRRYDSWELALAAYNAGPGRVNKAIKRARSKDYWRVRKYLPRETRNYVPAFIGATYVMHYYQMHNLNPQYPALDLQATATSKIYQYFTFGKISSVTGVPLDIIKTLNPSYAKNFIPNSQSGNYLILPQSAMITFLNYLGRPDSYHVNNSMVSTPIPAPGKNIRVPDASYMKTSYVVQAGDDMSSLTKLFKCSVDEVKFWNNLAIPYVRTGQKLWFYLEKEGSTSSSSKKITQFEKVRTLQIRPFYVKPKVIAELPSLSTSKSKTSSKAKTKKVATSNTSSRQLLKTKGEYVYYQIRRRETLWEIADRYPNISVKDIMDLNNFNKNNMPKAGTLIKIKKI